MIKFQLLVKIILEILFFVLFLNICPQPNIAYNKYQQDLLISV